jgi:hypothetical protein
MKTKLGRVAAPFDRSHQEASAETWAITSFGLVALAMLGAVVLRLV